MSDLINSPYFCNFLAIIGVAMFATGLLLFIVRSVKIKEVAIQFDKPHTWVNIAFMVTGIVLFVYSMFWCNSSASNNNNGDAQTRDQKPVIDTLTQHTISVVGYVYDVFGIPVNNAKLYANNSLTDDMTDVKGRFVLENLPVDPDIVIYASIGKKRSARLNINKATINTINGNHFCQDTLVIDPVDSMLVFACSSDSAFGPSCVPASSTFKESSLQYYKGDSTSGKRSVWIYIMMYLPDRYPLQEIHLKQSALYNEELQTPIINRTVIVHKNLSIAYNELPVWGNAHWQILIKTKHGKLLGNCDFRVVK